MDVRNVLVCTWWCPRKPSLSGQISPPRVSVADVRLLLCVFAVLTATLAAQSASAEEQEEVAPENAISLRWAKQSRSPQRARPAARDTAFHRHCGQRDLGLGQVASAIVERRITGGPRLSQRAIKRIARSAGVPYPFVAAWSLAGSKAEPAVDAADAVKRLAAWVKKRPARGSRRCGIARGMTDEGVGVLAVVMADSLAELQPFPVRTKVSKWLKLRAHVHPDATTGKVVLLGPRGRPKRVLASLSDGELRSRFTLDQPGRWIVQVVVDMESGPKPVLEMEVFAGASPPDQLVDVQPSASKHGNADLLRWLNDERKKEGLATVKRSGKLDAVARAHAIAMVKRNNVAHNVGLGSPGTRVAAAGIGASRVGENVARAATVRRIHVVLWDSPSHRENMLDGSFRYVGVAAVKDERGRVWSVQLFADQIPAKR